MEGEGCPRRAQSGAFVREMVELGSPGEEGQRMPGTREIIERISLLPGFRGILWEIQSKFQESEIN